MRFRVSRCRVEHQGFRALWLRTSDLKVMQREGWRAASVKIKA